MLASLFSQCRRDENTYCKIGYREITLCVCVCVYATDDDFGIFSFFLSLLLQTFFSMKSIKLCTDDDDDDDGMVGMK